jgi:hypothetical protein
MQCSITIAKVQLGRLSRDLKLSHDLFTLSQVSLVPEMIKPVRVVIIVFHTSKVQDNYSRPGPFLAPLPQSGLFHCLCVLSALLRRECSFELTHSPSNYIQVLHRLIALTDACVTRASTSAVKYVTPRSHV